MKFMLNCTKYEYYNIHKKWSQLYLKQNEVVIYLI